MLKTACSSSLSQQARFALIVITSDDMERDKRELEDLVAHAVAEMDLNPVEFMQPGNVARMNKL